MTSWYTENNRHFPEVEFELLKWIRLRTETFKATEMARSLNIPYNRATAWMSKLKRQGLLFERFRKYGLTVKGRNRTEWLANNRPETVL